MTATRDELAARGIRVKALEWENFDAWTWWAEALAGTYHVTERNGVWKAELRFRDAVHIVYEIDDFETAVIAANQHNEARILAALEVTHD